MTLTFDNLTEVTKGLDTVYYAISENVEQDMVYRADIGANLPIIIICHPSDLERVAEQIGEGSLIPLADMPTGDIMQGLFNLTDVSIGVGP